MDDGGEVAISQLPVSHRLLLLIALQIAVAVEHKSVSKVGAHTYEVSVPPCVVRSSPYLHSIASNSVISDTLLT